MYAHRLISCITVNTLLKRIYGTEQVDTTYSNTLSSVAFAGTVVGMLIFGYVSDRISRKFGMVSVLLSYATPRLALSVTAMRPGTITTFRGCRCPSGAPEALAHARARQCLR